jgi:hypothetical protein
MSIEELLKDNNDMLKQILQQLGNNNNNNEGLKSKQSYIDDLPDATMSATISESETENSTNDQEGGNIKRVKLRRGINSFKADPNKLGGDFSSQYQNDQDDQEIDEEIEEIVEINKNEPTKIGGNKPPKVLKILSIKTDKKKSKKNKKVKKSKKTKTTSNKITSKKNTSVKKTKKPLTGYQLFMKEQMPIWKKKNPKKTHKEAFGAIAKLWKLQKK